VSSAGASHSPKPASRSPASISIFVPSCRQHEHQVPSRSSANLSRFSQSIAGGWDARSHHGTFSESARQSLTRDGLRAASQQAPGSSSLRQCRVVLTGTLSTGGIVMSFFRHHVTFQIPPATIKPSFE
jgi:hypothetical protein